MDGEFEEMTRTIIRDASMQGRLGLQDIRRASVENLFKECAIRVVSDRVLLEIGRQVLLLLTQASPISFIDVFRGV